MIKGGNPIDTDVTQMISKGVNMPTKELENMSKNSSTNESSNENKVVIEVRVSTSNDNINPDLNQQTNQILLQFSYLQAASKTNLCFVNIYQACHQIL